ncbi:MAG: hypothetical protein LBK59_08850, partial [Bifidobacteriaceae bacterium]|nr:hypothetical protein [Bifidobacteriaceae bacterium]
GFTAARLIHPRIAYVTADTLGPAVHQATRVGDTSRASSSTSGITAGLFTAYRILDVLPYKIDMLRAYFRAKGVGDLAIKKRGVDADPDSLRRTLRLQGQERATAVLTRVEGRHSVIVVEPCLARRPQEH